MIAEFGGDVGERLARLVLTAPDHVFNMIEKYQLRCDPVRNGWIQAAANRNHEALHDRMTVDYARYGYEFEKLDQSQLQQKTGTKRYKSGLLCPTAGSLQPLSYTRELARVAVAAGVSVYTNSAVTGLRQEPDGWLLTTGGNGAVNGQVKCEKVLVCTNGYTGPQVKGLAKKLVPVRSVLIASEPLPTHLQQSILPNQVTLVDKRRLILYMRYDRDGRLCIGDHGPMRDAFNKDDFEAVKKRAIEVFPQLGHIRWEYHWGGRVAMTHGKIPFLYRVAPGLTAAMGYNGRGVGMGSLMGKVAATTILQRDDDKSDFPVTHPKSFLLHRFHGAGVNMTVKWYALLDHLESIQRGS
jgi:glycine/D-amino acid oxidase-like deaminating enzyme